MQFWQIFIVINILAAVFVIWPIVFFSKRYKKELRSSTRTETNSEVYKDHMKELERTLGRGEINEKELGELKRDLEKTLIEENVMAEDDAERPIISSFRSRIPVLVLVLALPILSFAMYSVLGAKPDWEIYQLARERVTVPVAESKQKSQALILALQDRVKQNPDNVQNWYLLAATAVEQADFDEGVRAYRRVLEIHPDSPTVKEELAQALFLRAGSTITPEVRKQTQEALAIAPNLPTALGLAGIDAYQSGDYQNAVDYWRRAQAQLDPKSAASQALNGGIARATAALAESGKASESGAAETVADTPSLQVKVSMDKSKVDVAPTDAVFVYARAWQGPKMPLAIKKLSVADLPASVTLDQSMSMTQGMDLASFPQVELVARISSSGSAISQAGDWQASFGPVIVAGQKDVIDLTISEQLDAK